MSDKSEEATPQRQRESKKKGQVANSKDLTQAALFMTSFVLLLSTGGSSMESLKGLMRQYIHWATTAGPLTPDAAIGLISDDIFFILKLVGPLIASIFFVALAIGYVQVGFIFTFEPMKPDLKKINPLAGLKKWFSPKILIELLKTVIKFAVVMALAYKIISGLMRDMVLSVGGSAENINLFLSEMITTFTIRCAVVFFVIAAADFFYQKKSHKDQMKMSKDEVKREYKESEGDPHFKHKRKELAHELVFNNMMKKARKATAVVVNPTHIAVAIEYDRQKGGAPQIVAKGQNLIADQIKQIAKEEGIPIMRNITLAQALNRVELGWEVPEDLYTAVAEVLNFVYRLGQQDKRKKAS